MNKIEYQELIAFHPGYYLKEYITMQGISQEELAKRLQATPKYISDLVNGKINLTDEMILKLSFTFGTSTKMWLNLNQIYIEKKLEIEERKKLEEECAFIQKLDYSYWVGLNLVQPTRKAKVKVKELQKFFKVSSLQVLMQNDFLIQYRSSVSNISDLNIINANAWIQTAINIAKKDEVEPYHRKMLLKAIPDIRKLILEEPEVFYPKLKKILADCGIIFIVLPNLKNCGVNGAVKWLENDKVLLALNDRRKYADIFWFSLFHELGHVLQKRIKTLIVSDYYHQKEQLDEKNRRLELEADEFSQNILIPYEAYQDFLKRTEMKFNEEQIIKFANEIKVLPGIVVGRLQNDSYLPKNSYLNKLKIKYEEITSI